MNPVAGANNQLRLKFATRCFVIGQIVKFIMESHSRASVILEWIEKTARAILFL